jgi:hypothetical protein
LANASIWSVYPPWGLQGRFYAGVVIQALNRKNWPVKATPLPEVNENRGQDAEIAAVVFKILIAQVSGRRVKGHGRDHEKPSDSSVHSAKPQKKKFP